MLPLDLVPRLLDLPGLLDLRVLLCVLLRFVLEPVELARVTSVLTAPGGGSGRACAQCSLAAAVIATPVPGAIVPPGTGPVMLTEGTCGAPLQA